jgi:fatty-acyl-CoA synthase
LPLRFAQSASEAYRVPLIIRHLLSGVLAKAGDQRILYRDQASLTYRDLVERIGRLASLLRGAGAEQGMTVAVMDWDSHRYLETYFAVPMMGAVLQTVNIRLPMSQIHYTLDHAKAEIIIVHRDFFPIVSALLPSLPNVKALIAIMDGVEEDLPAWAHGEYEALSATASPDYPFEDLDEEAVATTFYTTGTTGNPKGVCFTHRQLVLHTLAATGPFGAATVSASLGIDDVYMPLTPMFHVHAWGLPYVATMLGVKQVYPGRYDAEMICHLRSEHHVTYSHCVPTILEMVLQAADRIHADLAGWKMTIGGSALSRALCAEGRRRGMFIAAGYGMSETCPITVKAARRFPEQFQDEDEALTALTIAGITSPLVDARIVDEHMAILPNDGETRGELVLRAPWITCCYTNDSEASEALWRGGWMHTQDIATIDPRGHIQIRDRLKDVIKTGGEWVDSIQLEELVASAEGVAEAAVVAVHDAKWGERPLAVVVAQPGATVTIEELNRPVDAAIASGAITRYARLDRFELVDGLPRTSVGKIDKKILRVRFAEGIAAAG